MSHWPGLVLFSSIIISLVAQEQNGHFFFIFFYCGSPRRHRGGFLSRPQSNRAALWGRCGMKWPGLEEPSCPSHRPISCIPAPVPRCSLGVLLSVLLLVQHRPPIHRPAGAGWGGWIGLLEEHGLCLWERGTGRPFTV